MFLNPMRLTLIERNQNDIEIHDLISKDVRNDPTNICTDATFLMAMTTGLIKLIDG